METDMKHITCTVIQEIFMLEIINIWKIHVENFLLPFYFAFIFINHENKLTNKISWIMVHIVNR